MPDLPDSVWTRPPRTTRGDQPALSRAQIVRAAIELLDTEGAAGLSMRRLGTKLGSGTTSAYWYVTNKDELLELAVDEVLGEIYVPEPGDTGWRIGASILANGMRAALLRHPWVIGQLGARPTVGPNAMRMGDRTVALFTAAGFQGLQISYAGSLLHSHAIGAATTEAAMTAAARRAGSTLAGVAESVLPAIERTASTYPHVERWLAENGVGGPDPDRLLDDAFTFGLDRLLDGLSHWLTQQPNPPQQPDPPQRPDLDQGAA
ncbi:TetR/AcrR family transcriptional regulator [Actinoplanes awajinensis]|uniref:HTH tetR-type domain-containing protein n=1 Tax=Actinoplanes awajinensis subsp. mycoplanecinus TaxID=135947 RepID=A0A124G9G9_9ACTN|nr:TetR/AcrR family transcriptional regulator [Actinoplanes awajinensis]KUL29096.1 hypothetical protein ADL15_29910 [Actinoplanes awajinensis subsp. mycoplanecinus]